MKALTLWQPWASLVAMGVKQVETRCWSTKFRGEIAIHSASKLPAKYLGSSRYLPEFGNELAVVLSAKPEEVGPRIILMPRGAVLCVVRLVDVRETPDVRETLSYRERVFGNYEDGRYAWFFEMVEKFEEPIPAKGNRMLWNWQR